MKKEKKPLNQDEDDGEVTFEMETNDDATKVFLTLTSSRPMTMNELILALETYLTDLTRAEAQRREPGVLSH